MTVRNIVDITKYLCKLCNVRHASGTPKSKLHSLKGKRTKKDFNARIPVPDVRGEVLYGLHPVKIALLAGKRCLHAAFFKAGVSNVRLKEVRRQCEDKGVEILEVTGPVLDALAGNHPHQGVCLDVSTYEPEKLSGDTDIVSEELIRSDGKPEVWVLPYQVKDTMNMGAILRSCYYFGVDKVVVPTHYGSALNPVTSKASAGALEIMNIQSFRYESTMKNCLKKWREVGGTVVGSTSDESHEKALHLHKYSTDTPTLLILGNEAEGISEKISSYCDVLLCIPNFQQINTKAAGFSVNSLNVSVATGVLVHHLVASR